MEKKKETYLDANGSFDHQKWMRLNTVNERLGRSTFKMMDGNVHIQNMKSAMNFLADIYHDLEDEGYEPEDIIEFFVMKIEQKLGGRTR